MSRHSLPDDDPPEPAPGVLLRVARRVDHTVLVGANAVAAAAMFVDRPGDGPALLFLASLVSLRVWGVVFAVAAALLVADRPEPAHVVAVFGWTMLAYGSAASLLAATTPSPSGSIIGAGLMSVMASLHGFGLYYRAKLRTEGR